MSMVSWRSVVTGRPAWIIALWLIIAGVLGCFSPNLTRLAAEGQARLLGGDSESQATSELIHAVWPDQAYESLVVAALYRPGGLKPGDLDFGARLAEIGSQDDRPQSILRVLGPRSAPEVAARLRSPDNTVALVAYQLSTSFVAPATHETVAWLQSRCSKLTLPQGLELRWAGDALIGRDYMSNVQTSLNRAAVATVILLMIVLSVVYRSLWLALVPLATIGISLVIARSVLAWMMLAGWDVSSLVELFLVALLFGCGTDLCLLISWRLGETWDPANPAAAVRGALERCSSTLLTSAGTVMVGLLLMGTTRFKLFSSTGPSVAIGLAITLAATLTLTPALFVILARVRPRAFASLVTPPTRWWDRIAGAALARPFVTWAATVLLMAPVALFGLSTGFIEDVMTEMPRKTPSVANLRWLATKFEAGRLAPLTIVLESNSDLHAAEGLALIDEVSKFLARQEGVQEVLSATQPLGSTAPLEPARLAERIRAVAKGQSLIEAGSRQLQKGLTEGAAKIRAVLWLEEKTGLTLTGAPGPNRAAAGSNLKQAIGGLWAESAKSTRGETNASAHDPRTQLLDELGRAAAGAGQIAAGAARSQRELSTILNNPAGREALDRLLITDETVHDHPELLKSFRAYLSPDGHRSRIEVAQGKRIYSEAAMDQVDTLRRRLNEFLEDFQSPRVTASIAGENAESTDIRALVHSDQVQSWKIVPLGVFLVLLVTLRDPMACLNLVATMVLTYAFALGATHLLFVTLLGAPALDWKVPYFLFVLLVAVGVDYNVFLMTRLHEEAEEHPLRTAIVNAVGHTGGLITSAAAITACSFASLLFSPLGSLRQLGFALVVGILIDAVVVRPILVPCGHWLMKRPGTWRQRLTLAMATLRVAS